MKQHVDLYQARFRPNRSVLSAVWMGRLVLVGAVMLLLAFGWAQIAARREASALARLDAQQAEAALHVVSLAKRHPPKEARREVVEEVERRSQEREAKALLLRLLTNQSLGNREGFSSYLTALARQRVEGVWLRRVHLEEGGSVIHLAGSTLEPELVPRLVQRLGDEKVFAGKQFRWLRMGREQEIGGPIEFSLDTHEESRP